MVVERVVRVVRPSLGGSVFSLYVPSLLTYHLYPVLRVFTSREPRGAFRQVGDKNGRRLFGALACRVFPDHI